MTLALLVLLAQDLLSGDRPVVLLFTRTDCPISNRYAPEVNRLHQQYRGRVDFYLVYPQQALGAEQRDQHRAQFGYAMDVAADPNGLLVDRAGATVTPEAAVFWEGRLVYRGRIDDRYVSFGRVRQKADQRDLDEVLQLITAGKDPGQRRTHAVGCTIERPVRSAPGGSGSKGRPSAEREH